MLNAEGESALHEACLSDRPQNVEQLLRWGLDPLLTKSYRFPIHCAASISSIRSAAVPAAVNVSDFGVTVSVTYYLTQVHHKLTNLS